MSRTATFQETVTTTFVIEECCNCGVQFAMTAAFQKTKRQNRTWFYCPNGHSQHYTGETEAERIKREAEKKIASLERSLEWEKDSFRRAAADRDAAYNSLRATKGVVTKLKKRAANGVCPCCSRYFANLHRHMTTQHPDFAAEADA